MKQKLRLWIRLFKLKYFELEKLGCIAASDQVAIPYAPSLGCRVILPFYRGQRSEQPGSRLGLLVMPMVGMLTGVSTRKKSWEFMS